MPISAARIERQGFSLLEILVAIALLGVVIGMVGAGLRGSFRIAELQGSEPEVLRMRENAMAGQWAGERTEVVLAEIQDPP
jgi:prepilin-type N-terminal cleavage/methylation domain-containing protein